MMPLDLLKESIRRYIYNKKWEQLRPIQAAAIYRILTTDRNYILASQTASGKTEAAFLPILSKVNFNNNGVQVLYISPLVALINDQFERIRDLCRNEEVPVTKWHGESSNARKKSILKWPEGIVLITPESLESLMLTKPQRIKAMFENLSFVVIDEIHSFLNNDRGVQLKSLLFRLKLRAESPFRIIGLSATIGDYSEAKRFTGDEANTSALIDRTPKLTRAKLLYFDEEQNKDLPSALIDSLYEYVRHSKTLIFPNSRGRVELVAAKLLRIAEAVGDHSNYFAHHSAVDKAEREYAEFFAKTNRKKSFSIICTSTLELGIDIGSVDRVAQIGAPSSVSSFAQRLGRSGRGEDEQSIIALFVTNIWSMLQSLACWTLSERGFIEPPDANSKPFDVLVHQILSTIREYGGILYPVLIDMLQNNFAFKNISLDDKKDIVRHLQMTGMIDIFRNELIIGEEAEKMIINRMFFSTFTRESNFRVLHKGRKIGELPITQQVYVNATIALAARAWKIDEINFAEAKIHVSPAKNGRKPVFSGNAANVHRALHQEMFDILMSDEEYYLINQRGAEVLQETRKNFSLKIKQLYPAFDTKTDRPIFISSSAAKIFLFAGTKIMAAMKYLLAISNVTASTTCNGVAIEINGADKKRVSAIIKKMLTHKANIDTHLMNTIAENPQITNCAKWGRYLPEKYRIELLKQKLYDFDGAFDILENTNFVFIDE